MSDHMPKGPKVDDIKVVGFEPLVTPRQVKAKLSAPPEVEKLVLDTRSAVRDILRGTDQRRLLVIVGPCSIHDPQAAYEYAERLHGLKERIADDVLVIMRTYFEKPRTTLGWKGLINDPDLDGSCDIHKGVERAREILLEINRMGVPCASEALDPITPQYISDLISWASIGARTTESQTHREMASGLSMPVGFKNGTDGSLEAAINALISAGHPHSFLGINSDGLTSVVNTAGNPDRHVVLRGGPRPNYYREDVEQAAAQVHRADASLKRPIMVDTSHGNSSKDYRRQGQVCRDVVQQYATGQAMLMGLLMESNLEPGMQKWQRGATLQYGKSITDGCIGWSETEELLEHVAESVAAMQTAA